MYLQNSDKFTDEFHLYFSQESAGKTLKKLSENFLNIANTSSRTGEEIDKAGENLLTSWSTILNASLFTGQDTSKKNGVF
jgi:hypothetical protein